MPSNLTRNNLSRVIVVINDLNALSKHPRNMTSLFVKLILLPYIVVLLIKNETLNEFVCQLRGKLQLGGLRLDLQ